MKVDDVLQKEAVISLVALMIIVRGDMTAETEIAEEDEALSTEEVPTEADPQEAEAPTTIPGAEDIGPETGVLAAEMQTKINN